MEKIIQFQTLDSVGNCFAEAIEVRSKGELTKVANNIDPEMQRFIRGIKPHPDYQYVLMTPMGAHEFWGANVNGDIFPEFILSHDYLRDNPELVKREIIKRFLAPHGKTMPNVPIREFGFRTFMNARRYKHHVNKNPDISYGDIVFVTYNKNMHRVELIVRHDRAKAKRVGAEQIIIDIDNNKPRQISMGCRVPFDICSKCGNISKTTNDYCYHLRNHMGQVMDDGTVIGAINPFPRFFDLSDVFVPAAKEAGVLMKVASAGKWRSFIQKWPPLKEKVSSAKVAAVTKRLLPNAVSEHLIKSQRCEPCLPRELLRNFPIEKLLTTMSMLGMVAKPREFQYGMLHRMGRPSLAEKLYQENKIFRDGVPYRGPVARIHDSLYSRSLANVLSRYIPHRSGFSPHLPNRIIRITVIKRPPPELVEADGPLLNKIASAYTGYRKSLQTIGESLDSIIDSNRDFYNKNFLQDIYIDSMMKTSSQNIPLTVSYLHNAYYTTCEVPSWDMNLNQFSSARALLGSL